MGQRSTLTPNTSTNGMYYQAGHINLGPSNMNHNIGNWNMNSYIQYSPHQNQNQCIENLKNIVNNQNGDTSLQRNNQHNNMSSLSTKDFQNYMNLKSGNFSKNINDESMYPKCLPNGMKQSTENVLSQQNMNFLQDNKNIDPDIRTQQDNRK